ncbi:1-acyl-sn-glycerol-3-phosphate acyltransferase (plasmid) [Priestia megaterium]|uniref:1-acyl-sn-glycerol-3-phosphate acyltransferase n=2 Tax=Priestia megaterium TaxID=1404 RepID=A0A0B6ALD7_PRIM2|nr:lysophospholipid acyltransferase family protein [Priestia megaterium]AJI25695.1 1-acylglycerol-3-phosphate O-acyltransferases domain protein [Priestia megaterium NBRC 15308 = ATCC 14581]KFN07510.1 1-acylglycerol-3-phosphate O-acyltransferases domain protein [Priestia megaterium]KGJ82750.1 acyl-phosphate glycerol 3-phosphate acyltransferase [Priestia megaterium NBRC 15308 = ATCC 14581]MDR4229758.1 1-acyl-sn-glycerol-3-phosphate acyltransferase [Priestia megaterium]MED4399202.1 lysophospholip
MYIFATRILQLLLSSMNGHMNVVNKDKLPQNEPFIVVCTHKSWIDVVCLGIALYPTPIHFMAKKELFNKVFIKKLLKKLNAFPVDRGNPGPSVLKIPLQLLKKKQVVGIFPSGTRNSEEKALKNGAIHIASRASVPIIPAVYIGPHTIRDLLGRKKRFIIFGDTIHVPKMTKDKEAVTEATNEVISKVFEELKGNI